MVRDGYHYALPMLGVAILLGWLLGPVWGLPALVVAGFFLLFFRDPERAIPEIEGAIVSPGDGRVTEISSVDIHRVARTRISIFLNIFDVHVNRSPISGIITDVKYQRGRFGNAMSSSSADANEQNIVTVENDGETVIFKQIAGLIARRIVFYKRVGDSVRRGERVGLIKFGSRVDVIFDSNARLQTKIGDRVKGGSSVLAVLPDRRNETMATVSASQRDRNSL